MKMKTVEYYVKALNMKVNEAKDVSEMYSVKYLHVSMKKRRDCVYVVCTFEIDLAIYVF